MPVSLKLCFFLLFYLPNSIILFIEVLFLVGHSGVLLIGRADPERIESLSARSIQLIIIKV